MPPPNGHRSDPTTVPAASGDSRRRRTDTRRLPRGVLEVRAVLGTAHADARRAGQSGQVADRRRQQGRSPTGWRRRRARRSALQLRRLHQPRRDQGLRETSTASRSRSRRSTTPTRRSPRSAAARPLRHLLPELRPDQQAGDGRAHPAAEPQLHHEHRQRLADLHQPLVRPGLALHRAVHHLHHRHRLAHRPGERPTSRRCRIPTTCCGIRSTRARPRSSTTGTPRWRWCFCSKASPTSTPPRRTT